MSLLLLLSGVAAVNYPLNETFPGASGAPNARWTTSTFGTGTIGLDTNRLKSVVPAVNDASRALLADVIPTGDHELRGSYTFTSSTNQSVAFNFRTDGTWVTGTSKQLPQNGLLLAPSVVLGQVKLFTMVASAASQLGSTYSLAMGPTDTVNFHVLLSGTAVLWKAWIAGTAEPGVWQSATDTNHTARKRLGLAVLAPTSTSVTGYWDDVVANDYPTYVGTVAKTLDNATVAVSGSAGGASGTVAATLANVTTTTVGTVGVTGSLAKTLADMTCVAGNTGTSVTGTVARTLDPVVLAATGGLGNTGALARTLGAVTVVAAGTTGGVIGAVAKTLDAVEVNSPLTDNTGAVITDGEPVALRDGSGNLVFDGSGNQMFVVDGIGNPILVRGAEGSHGLGSTLAVTLANIVSTATGVTGGGTGSLAETLDNITSSAAGASGATGSLAETLDNVTSDAAGTVGVTGTATPTLGNLTSAASGTSTPPSSGVAGNLAVTLANATSAAGGSSVAGEVTRTLADLTSAAAGSHTTTGTAAIILADITSNASGVPGVSGILERNLANLTGDGLGSSVAGELAVTLDDITSSAVGAGAIVDFQSVTFRERGKSVTVREMV